jgi:hypothetical protein
MAAMPPQGPRTRLRTGRCSSATAAMPASVTRRSSNSVSDLRKSQQMCTRARADTELDSATLHHSAALSLNLCRCQAFCNI